VISKADIRLVTSGKKLWFGNESSLHYDGGTSRLTTNTDFDAPHIYENGTLLREVYLPLAGGMMTGALDMNNQLLNNAKLGSALDANNNLIKNIGAQAGYFGGDNDCSDANLEIGTSSTTLTTVLFYNKSAGPAGGKMNIDVKGISANGDLNMNGLYDITAVNNLYAKKFFDANDNNYYVDPSAATSAELNGRVSIGCQTPVYQLEVTGSASVDPLKISTGTSAGQEVMVVKTNGNIGIGTTNPEKKFEINGDTPLKFDPKSGYVEIYAGDSLVARIKP